MYIAMTGQWPGVEPEPSPVKVEPSLSVKKEAMTTASVQKEAMTPVKVMPGRLKDEPVVKAELGQGKEELAQSKAQPSGLRCLTSPAKILQLYQVQFSSSKDPAAESPSKKVKVDIQKCVDIYMYICECISNIIQGGEGAWCSWFLNILP